MTYSPLVKKQEYRNKLIVQNNNKICGIDNSINKLFSVYQ